MNQEESARLRANIPKLYLFAFFQMFLIIIPVIIPFWQAKGITLQEVFLLQGIFGASLIVFDGPAGYLADLFGRKVTLVIGSIISALGFQILWLGESFFHFAMYEVVIGLGLSLQSGCDVTILYNTLDKLKLGGRKAGYLGQRLTSLTIGEGIAALIGGILAARSLNYPAYANAVTAWIPVFIALLVYEPPGLTLPRGSHLENLRNLGRGIFGHSRLLTLAMLSFMFYGFATFCAIWSFQPYWSARGISVEWFGYLWAANNFTVAIIGRFAHSIENRFGSSFIVIAIALLPAVGYLGMGLTPGLWGLIFSFCFPICRAFNQVIFQDAINSRVPAQMRATANSVGSLGMRALFIVFGPIVGYILDTQGPDSAMRMLGYVYVVGFFALAIPLLRESKHFRTD